jgi:hypothetical protein
MVAKLARAGRAVSVSVPVVVVIDDADRLEPDLAVVLVENLIERLAGQVLVVAAVNPDGNLVSALTSRGRYGLTEGRVLTMDADPSMDEQARVELASDLCRELPAAATRRIGQRTQTFAEVFAVGASERLGELDAHGDDAAIVAVVDEVIDAQVTRAPPSGEAVVLAWAGGVMHARQVERAVEVLGEGWPGGNGDMLRLESVARLADPASPRLAQQVHGLSTRQRHQMAEIVRSTAVDIGGDPGAGLVERIVAWQAAHRVRSDLTDRAGLMGVQCQLVYGLEDLGDLTAAYQVAETALAEHFASQLSDQQTPQYDDLAAAVIRLARTRNTARTSPFIEAAVAAAAAGGAAVGLEALIWAAIDLLAQPAQREQALELADQITTELTGRDDLGAIGNRWRLLLAFHAGRAGYPDIAQQLLAPMLAAPSPPEDEDAARAVLYAIGGPSADIRLQIIGLEAELQASPPDADDDRLRLHHTLAADYGDLGDYRQALHHAQHELPSAPVFKAPSIPTLLGPVTASPTGLGSAGMWRGRCGCPRSCCPTASGSLAPAIPTPFAPGTTSRA